MTYLPPDIVDNDASRLVEALINSVRGLDQRQLDVALSWYPVGGIAPHALRGTP